jgi:hypothetical protein
MSRTRLALVVGAALLIGLWPTTARAQRFRGGGFGGGFGGVGFGGGPICPWGMQAMWQVQRIYVPPPPPPVFRQQFFPQPPMRNFGPPGGQVRTPVRTFAPRPVAQRPPSVNTRERMLNLTRARLNVTTSTHTMTERKVTPVLETERRVSLTVRMPPFR